MRARYFIPALLIVFFMPRSALACTCEVRDRNITDRLRNSAAVFIGTAVGERPLASSPGSHTPLVEITFIIQERWKSRDREVVRVRRDQTCGRFVTGRTYLVFADSIPGGLFIPPCALPSPDLNPEWPSPAAPNWRRRLRAMVDSLGPPSWYAPPPGGRDLRRLNASIFGDTKDLIDVMFVSDSALGRATSGRFSLELLGTHQRATMDGAGFFALKGVRPGLYVARVRYPSGVHDDQYVWIRCKPEIAGRCSAGGTLFSQRGRVR